MDTSVQNAVSSIASTVKADAIATYAYVLPLAFGVFVAIWAIKFGYGKLVRGMRGKH